MTIAQLLSLNGAKVPRYITVDGRTVFSGVTTGAAGLVHKTFGAVTPVAPHTFHGGADPQDAADEPWWSDRAEMQRHVDAVAAAFPNFEYRPADEDRVPAWVGRIDTGRGAFTVGVFMRRDAGLPIVRLLSGQRLGRSMGGRFVPSPHLYISGSLCIAGQDDWVSGEHTAATAIAWTAHWLAAFTEWRITTRWPIDGFEPHAA